MWELHYAGKKEGSGEEAALLLAGNLLSSQKVPATLVPQRSSEEASVSLWGR